MRTLIGTILVMCLPVVGIAQTISGYSGDIVPNGSFTVSGSGFGSKNVVAPVLWDNIESGSFNSNWSGTGSLSISTDSRHPNSSYCGTNNFQGSGGDGGNGYFTGPNAVLGEKWFVQYWFKIDNNWDWGTGAYGNGDENLANVKIFRMWNPGSINENFLLNQHGWDGGFPYYSENVSNSGGGAFSINWTTWAKGEWHCLQFEFEDSSQGGNDGVFRGWFDGAIGADDHDIMTRDTYSDLKRPFIVGFYDAWNDGGTDRDDFYIDDVYIDNSWARVEIGNKPDYNSCTHREVQIPVTWSDSSVTVTGNTGSFNLSDQLYIFVANDSGSVSSGFPIAGGGTTDTIPPQTTNIELVAPNFPDVQVTCETNEAAMTVLRYGLDTSYGTTVAGSTSMSTDHLFVLSNLVEDAVYYFVIEATDSQGNTSVTAPQVFHNMWPGGKPGLRN